MLRRIPLRADNPPKPWYYRTDHFSAYRRRRVLHEGTRALPVGSINRQYLRERGDENPTGKICFTALYYRRHGALPEGNHEVKKIVSEDLKDNCRLK